MGAQKFCLTADDVEEGRRLDVFLADQFKDYTRSRLQEYIRDGRVLINDSIVTKSGQRVAAEDVIMITIPDPVPLELEPEDIPLDIVYEDECLLVVNKPKQMVVHPAPGHREHTLVHALLYHCKGNLSGINGVLRPGIVHRIDQDTSGLLIVCKDDQAHNSIAQQLKEHSVKRCYHAIVAGALSAGGTIEGDIGRDPRDRKKMAVVPNGKHAVTHYEVLEKLTSATYISCRLETGRTHQIRVHMAAIGHPLINDGVYGKSARLPFAYTGQALHAKTIGFVHPRSGEWMEFDSELPDDFRRLLNHLS